MTARELMATNETADGDSGSGFLGAQAITSGGPQSAAPRGNGDSSAGRRETSEGAVYFEAALIGGEIHKPQQAHFAALTMRVDRGHHCLVVGGAAARRAAVFRAILAPQATVGAGVVGAPASVMHVSARPYVRPGSSLWDLLIFPHDKNQSIKRGVGERHLAAILRMMDFEFLLARAEDDWGRVVDWAKVLGPGEMYALALARLIYHSPAFALLDDMACLRADQIRQLFAVARRHHITLLVSSASPDPFDPLTRRADPSLLSCLGEFTRTLRLLDNGRWIFCSFGYSAHRPAFDDEPGEPLWGLAPESSKLRRRVSALSQCSTTERRWLMASPPPATESAGDSSRRQSRVVSPTLTARSSMSDFNCGDTMSPRVLSIDSALAKSTLLLRTLPIATTAAAPGASAASATTTTGSSSSSRASSSLASDEEAAGAFSGPAVSRVPAPEKELPSRVSSSVVAAAATASSVVEMDKTLPSDAAVPVENKQPPACTPAPLQNTKAAEPLPSVAVAVPAKNPFARSKNSQRSRPNLSLFAAAAKQAAIEEARQAQQPAVADISRRPFSRNGEEEEEEEGRAGGGAEENRVVEEDEEGSEVAVPAANASAAIVAKIRQTASSNGGGASSPSRIPRPPSQVSRKERASQQMDSSSMASLMATLSISSVGTKAMPPAAIDATTTGNDDESMALVQSLDDFTATLKSL
ncbi:ATP-binding cassette long-chain fatty acid transporter pxa2 [Coemansia thaxteri]|nr:ATP-binding cassette long-chain fatty acid transporter pxa2 [Coemansia thaxteri]